VIAWGCVALVLVLAFLAFLCWSIERAAREYNRLRK
jgi:flagellar biogenesis protein FliO